MLHEPAPQEQGVDHSIAFKMRLGVQMFTAYALFYIGFVAIGTLAPTAMEMTVLFGMNLACVYGFALIIVALILAVIYNHKCTAHESSMNMDPSAPATPDEEPKTGEDN